jgi:Uma2 family endonuclease
MSTAELSLPRFEQRFVFRDADWEMYQGFLELLGQRPVRLTYDRGVLELMTLSFGHERLAELIGDFVGVITDELDMPRQNGGSTTFNRKDLDRGLEPDKCFYLANEPQVRGKDEIDLAVDPPPDLAVEIDVSRSSIDRLTIYAALRVPEVWRFDGDELTIYRLNPAGGYAQSSTSGHFPQLAMGEIVRFLKLANTMDQTKLVRTFRDWVRQQNPGHP